MDHAAIRDHKVWVPEFQCGTGIPARDLHWKFPPAACPWHVALRAGHFSGARTCSPQRLRGTWRGAFAGPSACGLGSPRSRGIPTGRDARGTLALRAVNALAAAGHSSGARTSSPQRVRGACRGACAGPSACGLGSPRSRGNPHGQGCPWHTGAARGAFPGARTFSPQRLRGACRGACAGPSACGLGSPRSRGNPHGQGCPWHTALRAVNALAAAGHSSGARTCSPQRLRGTWRGAFTCPSACGLGSRRSRGNPHGQDARGTLALRTVNALAAAGHSSGARTSSPQRVRGACRGACAGPSACGLGSPRSRGNSHGQGCPCHTALRAVNALAAAGHSSGARTFSPQRLRGTWRGACACPSACGLGSRRSRGNAHGQGCRWHSSEFTPRLHTAGLERVRSG